MNCGSSQKESSCRTWGKHKFGTISDKTAAGYPPVSSLRNEPCIDIGHQVPGSEEDHGLVEVGEWAAMLDCGNKAIQDKEPEEI